jgi:hypothetical protein
VRAFGYEIRRASKPATRFIGEIVKVELSPGDVCVLMASARLSKEIVDGITATWRASVGDDITLIVLDEGLKLGVLSPPQAAVVHQKLTDEAVVQKAVDG